jgi:AraC-like DNA-binding protein
MESDFSPISRRGTVLSTLVRAVLATASDYGIDAEALASAAGLDQRSLARGDGRIPADRANELWRLAVAATGEPALGLIAGSRMQPASAHAVGLTWFASCTLRDALCRLHRFHRVMSSGSRTRLTETRAGLELELHSAVPDEPLATEIFDGFFAVTVRFSRMVKDEHYAPLHVLLERDDPGFADSYELTLGVVPRFGADRNAIVFPKTGLDDQLPAGDRRLALDLDAIAERQLAAVDSTTLSDSVAAIIETLLPSGRPTLNMVARFMKRSTRTLQRSLREEGTSFSELAEHVQRQMALRHVSASAQSLSAIAQLVGFSDQSNFNRAFRRWTGASPGAWRDTGSADRN